MNSYKGAYVQLLPYLPRCPRDLGRASGPIAFLIRRLTPLPPIMASPSLLWPPFITGATCSGAEAGMMGILEGETALIIDGDELLRSWFAGDELLICIGTGPALGL